MKFGSIQITKRTKEGDCAHCEDPIDLGESHATVTIRIRPKSPKAKGRFINWHIHIKCIGLWLLAQLVARQDRRKAAGRPKNTGLKLPPEDKKKRLALCKKRMRILREVEACNPKDEALRDLFFRFNSVGQALDQLGGPAKVNKRTTLDLVTTEKKLLYGRSLDGQVRTG